jgi:VanZ family protein
MGGCQGTRLTYPPCFGVRMPNLRSLRGLMDRLFQPRTRRILAVLWALAWLVVAVLLLMPVAGGVPEGTDKLVHFAIFACMAFGAVSFSHRAGQLSGLALLTVAGGTALEFAQRLTSWRTFDLTDAAANTLGASSGYAIALLVLLFWIRPALPAQQSRIRAAP